MRNLLPCCALTIAGMMGPLACDSEDGDPNGGPCREDFDCSVGYVCEGATADSDGTCAEAGPGAERDFGRVTLSFPTGDELFLLSVFALPTEEGAGTTDAATFTLSAGAPPSGALRMAPASRGSYDGFDPIYWEQRLAFEGARRARIAQLVRDVRAGTRSLYRAAPRQGGDCSACQDSTTQMCWGGCTSTPVLKSPVDGQDMPCTLVHVAQTNGVKVNVVIADADNTGGAEAAAVTAANAFASALERALDLLGQSNGHSGSLDHDGDGRLLVVYTEALQSMGIVGGFNDRDFLPGGDANASGNEADILWARVPSSQTMGSCPGSGCTQITQELSIGTLVHEYTHLTNLATRVYAAGGDPAENEILWLDEGMAHLMEDLTGYGASNIGTAAMALFNWDSVSFASGEDSVAQRGQAFTLLRHIIDQEAKAQGAATADDAISRYKIHSILVKEQERGFLHSPFQDRGAEGIWQWLLGVYATNNPDVDPDAYDGAFDFLPTATVASTGQTTGFDPFGDFTDAKGVDVPMDGPTMGDGGTDELTDFSDPFSSEVPISGGWLFQVLGMDAGSSVTLTGRGGATVDLQLRAQRVQ